MATAMAASAKSIVIYFSHTGENYAVGNITVGNTAKVAKEIAAQTGAATWEIKEAKPYPANYDECVALAKKELREKALEICRRLARRFNTDNDDIEDEIRRAGPRVLVFALVPEHITGKLVHEA